MTATSPNQFSIGLCEVGDCESCMFSYCCSCCALAQARTHVDNSPTIFNCCILTPVVERWLIRSAYDIPGDACQDCYTSTFCICCAANQAYQTAKTRGVSADNSGRYANVNAFVTPLPAPISPTVSYQDYLYSCCCMPCAQADILERAINMPWYMGCCCANVCATRNLLRYQYRIKGNDVVEECVGPCGLHFLTNIVQQCFPCAGCMLWGAYATVTTQLTVEARNRPALTGPYLTGYTAPTPAPLFQPSLSPIAGVTSISPAATNTMLPPGVQMGVPQLGPPHAGVTVYTHQPMIGNSGPVFNTMNRSSGYAQVSVAEPFKEL